jgi:hypothetical protein
MQEDQGAGGEGGKRDKRKRGRRTWVREQGEVRWVRRDGRGRERGYGENGRREEQVGRLGWEWARGSKHGPPGAYPWYSQEFAS